MTLEPLALVKSHSSGNNHMTQSSNPTRTNPVLQNTNETSELNKFEKKQLTTSSPGTSLNLQEVEDKFGFTKLSGDPIFLGCFKDDWERDLEFLARDHASLSECDQLCSARNFSYFALQYGDAVWKKGGECYCGNSYGKYGSVSNCNCDVGKGAWINCVYEVSHPSDNDSKMQEIFDIIETACDSAKRQNLPPSIEDMLVRLSTLSKSIDTSSIMKRNEVDSPRIGTWITTCGRSDLLRHSIESFESRNTYPLAAKILVDDCGGVSENEFPGWTLVRTNFSRELPKFVHLCLGKALGLLGVLEATNFQVDYVFQNEDDWSFEMDGFIEYQLSWMERDLSTDCNLQPDMRISMVHASRFWKDVCAGTSGFACEISPDISGKIQICKRWGHSKKHGNFLRHNVGFSYNPSLLRVHFAVVAFIEWSINHYEPDIEEAWIQQLALDHGFVFAFHDVEIAHHDGEGRHIYLGEGDPVPAGKNL